MSVIFILISCSLLLAVSFLGAFLWASKAGQFDDDYTPSVRMLFEDGAYDPSKSIKEINGQIENGATLNKTMTKSKAKT